MYDIGNCNMVMCREVLEVRCIIISRQTILSLNFCIDDTTTHFNFLLKRAFKLLTCHISKHNQCIMCETEKSQKIRTLYSEIRALYSVDNIMSLPHKTIYRWTAFYYNGFVDK